MTNIFRPHRVYDSDEAAAKLARMSRNAYRLSRLYRDIVSDATTGGRLVTQDKTTGGGTPDPTQDSALDVRRQAQRARLPGVCALADVADRALIAALDMIRSSDRSPGEPVGDTGMTEDGLAKAEARAAAMPKPGVWVRRSARTTSR